MIFWTLFLPLTACFMLIYFHFLDVITGGRRSHHAIDMKYDRVPVKREIINTVLSLFIFASFGLLTGYIFNENIGLSYSTPPSTFSEYAFMIGSFFIALIIQDIYFYWTHRFLHVPFMFKNVHLLHHRSTDTNAWSAYSFHPVEAVFQIGIIPLLAFIAPVHEVALICFGVLLFLITVYGHSGYELRHKKGKALDIFNSSLHHFQHHKYVHYNFGIFLRIWDKVFGTEYPKYELELDELRKQIDERDANN